MSAMTDIHQFTLFDKCRLYIGSSVLFVCIFVTATMVGFLILLSTPFSYWLGYQFAKYWCALVIWMAKFFCGLTYDIQGLEHIKECPVAIALCKHQSAWETLAMRWLLPEQATLLKRSLLWFPVWGWALGMLKPIAIDRKNAVGALRTLIEKGTLYLKQGSWVVIFPEGTRTAPGEKIKFNAGGAMLAQKTGVPIIPIAHNAGEFWPRYSFLKYPGCIKVVIGPPIESGNRKAQDINAEAEAWIHNTMKQISSVPIPD
ncbi:lysophospholipid acyltransferase family protein [Methylicorpusculum sp.]|uniref:lysophospholipid acyltransferase family protein n=1 Tax=Methylicorpusculum sp. TaxID=2713644 RepID=UPI00351E4168